MAGKKKCSVCGNEIGGFFGTSLQLNDESVCKDCQKYFNTDDNGIPEGEKIEFLEKVISDKRPDNSNTVRYAGDILNRLKGSDDISMKKTELIMSTTDTVPGYEVVEILGPVTAVSTYGAGFIKTFMASVSATLGTQSNAFNNKYQEIIITGENLLCERAVEMKANAVIDIHYSVSNFAADLSGVLISGTAVVLKKLDDSFIKAPEQ